MLLKQNIHLKLIQVLLSRFLKSYWCLLFRFIIRNSKSLLLKLFFYKNLKMHICFYWNSNNCEVR